MRVQPVSPKTADAALRYLARSPYLNVFISHVLLADPPPAARKNVLVALDGDVVAGVAYSGRQLAIAAEPHALVRFAEYSKEHRGERMIIGARETIRRFWELIRSWHPPPRLVRERQLVMAVDRKRLRPFERRASVRQARTDEWEAVADSSAHMVRQELAYDPRRGSGDFSAAVREMIARKLWWVGSADGELCFFCNVGPWCDRTVQLQGIWTPPELRGRGLATAALAAICDRLLNVSPTISLYVNDFNAPAIALYRRVGFEHVGDFQTLLF
jgi:RimJ/RimL family protein N-acetyltransferase